MTTKLPVVAIVGRRNVGKSTLFNTILRENRAIVDAMPGLTRDIISYRVKHHDTVFMLADTPGLDLPDSSALSTSILENAHDFLSRADVVLFLMEHPAPESFDIDLADIIRKLSLPTIIAVNKIDTSDQLESMVNFYETGFQDLVPISARRRFNIELLLDKILGLLPAQKTAEHHPDLKIAIAGRPNAGKSTLLNAFLGYDRAVVSEIPGTTRDAVDEEFSFQGKRILVIDTAGMRKKSRMHENLEYWSFTRTLDAIKRSDVVIHLVDAIVGLTDTDKKISDEIVAVHRPVIIAVNKWDAVEKDHRTFDELKKDIRDDFYRASDYPIVSISAKDRTRIHALLTMAIELRVKAERRFETPVLNRLVARLQTSHAMPLLGETLKIYYITQIGGAPPRFKLFVNNPDLFRRDIVRFLEKALQKELDLEGVPVHLQIEGRSKEAKGKVGRSKKKRR